MTFKPLDICLVLKRHRLEEPQQRRRKRGLRIERIERGILDFARPLLVAVQPFRVESQ